MTSPHAPTTVSPPTFPLATHITARAAGALTSLPPFVLRLFGQPTNTDGDTLDSDVRASLLALKAVSGEDFADLEPPAGRTIIDHEAHLGALTYMQVGSVTEYLVEGVRVRHYRPAVRPGAAQDAEDMPTLIYMHGGGWVLGSLNSHDSTCRWICAKAEVAVISVDYRLAPEAPFPAGLVDVTAVASAALSGKIPGVDRHRVAVGGDSAGGNLAAALCLRLRDEGKALPRLQMLFVPVTDLRTLDTASHREFAKDYFLTAKHMRWYREHYTPNEDDRDSPYVSPLAAQDLSGLPAAYVAVAGFDPLRDEGEEYARRMRDAGVPVSLRRHTGLVHPFVNSTGVWRGARAALDEAVGALRLGLGVVTP